VKLYRVYGIRHEAVVLARSSEEAIQKALEGGQVRDWEDPQAVEVPLPENHALVPIQVLDELRPRIADDADPARWTVFHDGQTVCIEFRAPGREPVVVRGYDGYQPALAVVATGYDPHMEGDQPKPANLSRPGRDG